jgi:hypothetical protein
MKILVEKRSVYGKELIYPVCEKAKLFADLVAQKILTDRDISFIKQLGYEVVIQAQEIKL